MKFNACLLSQTISRKLLTLAIAFFLPVSGYCQELEVPLDRSIYDLVKQQQKMLKQQQQEIDELRTMVLEQQGQTSKKLDNSEDKIKKMAKPSSNVRISRRGLRIDSNDGSFSFRAGGRIHADYAYYDDDVTQLGSGANLRRARLGFRGKFFNDWRYKAEIDFAEDGDVGPQGVWLSYRGWKPVSLKLGNFQEYFSLEEMTSSNAITFMERSLANSFAPSYRLGFGINSYGKFWGLSGGLFGEDISNKDDDIDDGWGFSGRATLAPLLSDSKLLHIGFSSEYRETDTDNTWRIRAKPESRVTERRLVNTGTIAEVDHSWLLGGEIAAAYGPYSLQAEYIHNKLARIQEANLDFSGGYVQGSWFLTGESRPYNVRNGNFGLINPQGTYGAWELALRYSWIDLDDRDITGGQESNITVGLNWYVNYNVRFMMNYIHVNAHPNRNGINENPNIFQVRGQLVF